MLNPELALPPAFPGVGSPEMHHESFIRRNLHRFAIAGLAAATLAFTAIKAESADARAIEPVPAPAVAPAPDNVSSSVNGYDSALNKYNKQLGNTTAPANPWYGDRFFRAGSDRSDIYAGCQRFTTWRDEPVKLKYNKRTKTVTGNYAGGDMTWGCWQAGTFQDSAQLEVRKAGSKKFKPVGAPQHHTLGMQQELVLFGLDHKYRNTSLRVNNVGKLCVGANQNKTRMRLKITDRFNANPGQTFQHEGGVATGRSDNVPSATVTHYGATTWNPCTNKKVASSGSSAPRR